MQRELLAGVTLTDLIERGDERGSLTELFRAYWLPADIKQWNLERSSANTIRGVRLHNDHHDYLVVIDGEGFFALYDARPDSPTFRTSRYFTLSGKKLQVLHIPPGVCHGFYFTKPTTHLVGVSEFWHPRDKHGVRYDDPGLAVPWPFTGTPIVTPKDQGLGTLEQLLPQVTARYSDQTMQDPTVDARHPLTGATIAAPQAPLDPALPR